MIDLAPFCFVSTDDYCRPNIEKPFNLGGFTYATNGHILIRVTERPEYAGNEGVDPKHLLPRLDAGLASELIPIPPCEIILGEKFEREPCSDCNGSGKVRVCQKCNGVGYVTCSECGSDEKNCPDECKGGVFLVDKDATGDDIVECEECEGTGKGWKREGTPDIARFGPQDFQRKYIDLIASLPNVRIGFGDDNAAAPGNALVFVFDGGAGLLMSYRRAHARKPEAPAEATAP